MKIMQNRLRLTVNIFNSERNFEMSPFTVMMGNSLFMLPCCCMYVVERSQDFSLYSDGFRDKGESMDGNGTRNTRIEIGN